MTMRNVITQTVVLDAPAERLFGMYVDPAAHAAITGGPVTISRDAGSEFVAFGGVLTGTMLAVCEGRLIVQSWRIESVSSGRRRLHADSEFSRDLSGRANRADPSGRARPRFCGRDRGLE